MANQRSLDGPWLNRIGEHIATIEDGVVCWVNGPCSILEWHSSCEFVVKVEGAAEYCARLNSNGDLAWSDGDMWVQQKTRHNRSRASCDVDTSQEQRRRTWEACGGSGGGGAGDEVADKVVVSNRYIDRRRVCGSTLLPDRTRNIVPSSQSLAYFCKMASLIDDGCGYSAYIGEGTCVRVLIGATSPSYIVMELNSVPTYNMMDPNLSWDLDYADDAALLHLNRSHRKTLTPIGCITQGAGPHFCPGGNPRPEFKEGKHAFDAAQFCGYHPFIRLREFGLPTVCCGHGAQVGGGCAYALNCTVRVGAHTNTICFGNASRGAVPGMMLSQNVIQTMVPGGGMDLYLSDFTFSAWGAMKGGFLGQGGVGNMPQGSKTLGFNMMKKITSGASACRLLPMQQWPNEKIFADETFDIDYSGRTGEMFSNVKVLSDEEREKKKLKDGASDAKSKVEKIPRPEGMPGRLPGQHLKGLRPSEQAVCVQCGKVAQAGVWGLEQSDFEGMFFCHDCWYIWDNEEALAVEQKKKGKAKRRARPKAPPPPTTLKERATAVHGDTVQGGILSWAAYCATCCSASMQSEAQLVGDQGGKQRYGSVELKDMHRDVYSQLLAYSWAPGGTSIEVSHLVEACSFTLWRDRMYGTGVVEVLAPAAFGDLSEYDARWALQSELRLKHESFPLLIVEQGDPAPNAMLFNDPAKTLGDQADTWWQFVGTESSRTAAALLVSSLLACVAAKGVKLLLNGKPVTNFGFCKGEYTGKVAALAVEDRSRGSVFMVPRRIQQTNKLCTHDWVFVTAEGGEEYCIDLAAAQFGDKSRGKNGCPSVFSKKDDFEKNYKEKSRDQDPVQGYRDMFQLMLQSKEEEMNKEGKPWYKRSNHVEVFVSLSGKVCSLLGVV